MQAPEKRPAQARENARDEKGRCRSVFRRGPGLVTSWKQPSARPPPGRAQSSTGTPNGSVLCCSRQPCARSSQARNSVSAMDGQVRIDVPILFSRVPESRPMLSAWNQLDFRPCSGTDRKTRPSAERGSPGPNSLLPRSKSASTLTWRGTHCLAPPVSGEFLRARKFASARMTSGEMDREVGEASPFFERRPLRAKHKTERSFGLPRPLPRN
jgi:hypothetical protein